jgi:DNA polymerase III epsilon subunit-like protein
MPPDEIDLATIAETLAKSPDYRVLRRLTPRSEFASCEGQATKVGILLDVETTGLNTAQDEIIELAMVNFDNLPDGRRLSANSSCSRLWPSFSSSSINSFVITARLWCER